MITNFYFLNSQPNLVIWEQKGTFILKSQGEECHSLRKKWYYYSITSKNVERGGRDSRRRPCLLISEPMPVPRSSKQAHTRVPFQGLTRSGGGSIRKEASRRLPRGCGSRPAPLPKLLSLSKLNDSSMSQSVALISLPFFSLEIPPGWTFPPPGKACRRGWRLFCCSFSSSASIPQKSDSSLFPLPAKLPFFSLCLGILVPSNVRAIKMTWGSEIFSP